MTGKPSVSIQLPRRSFVCVAGVEITSLIPRPKTKMKLRIKLEGTDYEVEIDEGGLVQWTGVMCVCSSAAPGVLIIDGPC